MKHTFFLIAFFSFINTSVAQNDLVFNEAKFVTLATNPNNATTVPEGKVWKVESYSTGRGTGYGGSLLVNNESFIIPVGVPIVWIPAGSTIRTGGSSLSSGYIGVDAINVLEFNVISASDGGGSSGTGFSSEGLEFSNVINFESSQVITSSSQVGTETAGSFTIPDGKVWKITNVMVTKQGTGGTGNYLTACSCSGFIDNTIVYDNITNFSGINPQRYTPYWLTGGNHTLKISDNNSSSAGERFIISYSAIEYNLPE
jgi:hypothetical protein